MFGFLDPSLVIRRCHLIPCFPDGRATALLKQGHSVARGPKEEDDQRSFYVNMYVVCHFINTDVSSRQPHRFADRDIFCHFARIGVGHKIQYPIPTTFGASDEPNEGDGEHDSGNELESDCASTSGCTTNVAAQARDDWAHSEESSDEEDNDEYGTPSEMEDEDKLEDELDNCSNSISDDEDIRF